ncbi:alpha/beta hydrolase [Actinosynnema pretiosum]|uniref:Alpha/beta hydrolase n=1 Tax=Actinosynnema pretiosum TaxID=42197 RepID=A0A290Z0T7_9PSEU|nr:alpha/beta hydrolase [Actinosynnema pretiosum]
MTFPRAARFTLPRRRHPGGVTQPQEATRTALTRVPLSTAALPPLDTAIPPWPGEQVQVDGHRLHVRTTPGPEGADTAVYVHGLGGSSTNWTDLSGQLAGHVEGRSVDLPGFGRSEPVDGYTYSIAAHARAVTRYLESLGRPVHLFGNSMGGTISLVIAATRPELVKSLVLVSPAMPDLRLSTSRMADPLIALAYLPLVGRTARKRLAQVSHEERARQTVRLCFSDPSIVPDNRIAESGREVAERATQAWASAALGRSTTELVRSWLLRGPSSLWLLPPEVTAPTLVVWGADDRLVSVRKAPRLTRSLPRGRMLVLPRTGHVAQMERPVLVARAVAGMWEAGDRW